MEVSETEVNRVGLVYYDCPSQKENFGHNGGPHAEEGRVETQVGVARRRAKGHRRRPADCEAQGRGQAGLRAGFTAAWPCWRLESELLASRTMRTHFRSFQPLGLWHSAPAARGSLSALPRSRFPT